ncbi:hypothetical protein DFJ74DRAFT_769375 [Hyaloraphidium curvatum]|nr:hypothetical protein DFJ74DRAFT_769375 [Hyaloraphidium curvatum]
MAMLAPLRPLLPAILLSIALLSFAFSLLSSTGPSVPPPARPARDDACLYNAVRARLLSNQLDSLRKQYASAYCKSAHDVSSAGQWCLFADGGFEVAPGYPMSPTFHVVADPGLASFLMEFFKPGQEILDVGCGIGQYGLFFRQHNASLSWRGIDGALNVPEFTNGFVEWADLSVPQLVRSKPFHWVMSLEVAEHLPQEFETIFLDNLDRHATCGVVLSWALPRQGGHNHVNERPPEYVAARMKERDMEEVVDATALGREQAQYRWFKQSFRVFRRASAPPDCL